MRDRVEQQTYEYYQRLDKAEREFEWFADSIFDDVTNEFMDNEERMTQVSEALIDDAHEKIGNAPLWDKQVIYAAINLACAVHYHGYNKEMMDAKESFEEALLKSSTINKLVKDEIELRWDLRD